MRSSGHVFVVRGRIGEMVADAAVVSTDADFTVEDYWHPVVSPDAPFDPAEHRPEDWEARGWGRSRVDGSVWFVDVTPARDEDGFDRLSRALQEMARSGLTSAIQGRPMPLVVTPVIATRGGGLGERRGRAIDRLLTVCRDFVRRHPVDVAVVAVDPSSYAALQHRRRETADGYFEERHLDSARPLGEAARDGSLALFLGAGTSIPAGVPSWKELIAALAAEARLEQPLLAGLQRLSPLDQAELLRLRLGRALGTTIADLVRDRKPALAHLLLAALDCQGAVTTNYDDLYEDAVTSGGGDATAVLPTEVPRAGSRWLLKMHGDSRDPDSIVLTRGQFVGFTTESGPAGAVLQALLLTKHLLVVGTSMTDDNVLRLIHEVAAYRQRHHPPVEEDHGRTRDGEKFGTILDVEGDPARREVHSTYFRWHEMAGDDVPDRARQLEIFLDAVAMHATSNHEWLLDTRFSFLHHGDRSAELVERARALAADARRAAEQEDAWRALAEALEQFGASSRPVSSRAGRTVDEADAPS